MVPNPNPPEDKPTENLCLQQVEAEEGAGGLGDCGCDFASIGFPGQERWTLILGTIREQLSRLEVLRNKSGENESSPLEGLERANSSHGASAAEPGRVGYAQGWTLLH
ncbi:MAG: hypothetical protein GY944_14815 [bacterium]|nr:hypothetical protein [bacterium]